MLQQSLHGIMVGVTVGAVTCDLMIAAVVAWKTASFFSRQPQSKSPEFSLRLRKIAER